MINSFITTTKALADPNRVRALMVLREQELCVCRLIELLKLAPSTVSKHLTILKQAGLIESRKEGRWMHYRLPSDKNTPAWRTLEWIFQSLDGSLEIEADRKRIRKVMTIDLNELTQIYKKQGA
jgi:DNA-binding transcriptional ArsR family regulator